MNILYIAYSCDPYNGSEDQIGWNIPIESARSGNKVFIITKKEHEKTITSEILKFHDLDINFYFVDIPFFYKKIFFGLFYSMRIILWQKRALKFTMKLIKNINIQIIHQVSPVEIRALGNYGKKTKIPFLAGPVGGGFPVPKVFNPYTKKYFLIEYLRKILNLFTYSLLRVNKKISYCKYLLITNYETKSVLDKFKIFIDNDKWLYHCDIGISLNEHINKNNRIKSNQIVFLVPGRLTYRKGHLLLFDSIPRNLNPNISFCFKILGIGPLEKKLKKIVRNDPFLNNHVIFGGKIAYSKMKYEYMNCDVVVLPSLSEATGTVLLEGMSHGKPIITARYFGANILLDDSCAWLYSGRTTDDLIDNFRNSITDALVNQKKREIKGENAYKKASNYTWKSKVSFFNSIYRKILSN